MRIFGVAAALIVSGCGAASVLYPASVQPLGPDTFAVSAEIDRRDFSPGLPGAQSKALEAAKSTCDKLGKQLLVKSTENAASGHAIHYSATFRCLNAGDPELTRPDLERVPDVVVQDRRQ